MLPIESRFRLNDGRELTSLLDLYVIAKDIPKEVFDHHVNAERNDFARWVRDVFFDNVLAGVIKKAKSRNSFWKTISENIRLPMLAMNAGSSSVKFELFMFPRMETAMKGMVEAIGLDRCSFHFTLGKISATIPVNVKTHDEAVGLIIKTLLDHRLVKSRKDIIAVGHRVVHGGEKYSQAVVIDDSVIQDIEALGELAPLHNPKNLAGIRAVMKELPFATNIAVFDTAFHHTIPKEAFMYGLPYELYEKFKIRKYGFHGINHQYLAKQAHKLLGKKDHEIITCHLGNGSSIAAIKNGRSVDTSMGFTPLDGLIMGTRSGEIDPDIVLFLLKNGHYTQEQLEELLNKKSGMLGISGISPDFRDLRDAASSGNKKAKLAIDMLAYRIALFIGGYMTILHGLDAIVFSGGIGENAGELRKKILAHLAFAGLKVDEKRNRDNAAVVSSPGSKIKAFVIPAHEEAEIAEEVWQLLAKNKQ